MARYPGAAGKTIEHADQVRQLGSLVTRMPTGLMELDIVLLWLKLLLPWRDHFWQLKVRVEEEADTMLF